MNTQAFATIHAPRVPDNDILASCRLHLMIQPNLLTYVFISSENRIKYAKSFLNEQDMRQDIFLRVIFESEEILSSYKQECVCISAESRFTLIPNSFHSEREALQIARAVLEPQLGEHEIHSSLISTMDAWSLYILPDATQHILQKYFPKLTNQHITPIYSRISRMLSETEPDHILLHAFPGYIIMTICKQGSVHLMNAYPYRTEMDAYYFLRSNFQIMHFDNEVPIYAMGMFNQYAPTLLSLKKDLPNMKPLDIFHSFLDTQMDAGTPWHYAFLAV
ncbi:MAG: DUF3822 family protein [Bacteroidota bacterium]